MNNIHKLQNIFVAKSEHYYEYSEAQQKKSKKYVYQYMWYEKQTKNITHICIYVHIMGIQN